MLNIKHAISDTLKGIHKHIYYAMSFCNSASILRMLGKRYEPNINPTVGIHTVFIARENIVFIREWIEYYRLLGVSEFYLYDNSKVEIVPDTTSLDKKNTIPGHTNKYGIPYGDIISMSDDEIAHAMEQIKHDIPGVHFIDWSPRNKNYNIIYGQRLAHNDVLHRFGSNVDWMLSVDMDEFLVLSKNVDVVSFCIELERKGYTSAYISMIRMMDRWGKGSNGVLDNTLMLKSKKQLGYWAGKKYIYRPNKISDLNVHHIYGSGPTRWMLRNRAVLLHYNVPWYEADLEDYVESPWKPPNEDHLPGTRLWV